MSVYEQELSCKELSCIQVALDLFLEVTQPFRCFPSSCTRTVDLWTPVVLVFLTHGWRVDMDAGVCVLGSFLVSASKVVEKATIR